MEPKCYQCIHRGEIPGDTHSICNHPDTADARNNSLAQIAGWIGGGPIPSKGWSTLKIVGNSQGVRRGWFRWPLNFDPIWLLRCEGFQEKPEAKS